MNKQKYSKSCLTIRSTVAWKVSDKPFRRLEGHNCKCLIIHTWDSPYMDDILWYS